MTARSWREVARGYLVLPHLVPIVAVLAATTAFAWVIVGSSLDVWDLVRLLAAMLGGQIVVGVVNELIDAPTDAVVKPEKPIPAGLVSPRGAMTLGITGLALMLVAGATFGWVSVALLVTGNGLGVIYSLWFKRTRFAWLPYFLALPLLPIWVAVSFDRFDARLLLLYPIGGFAVLGLQLAQAVPDVEADRASGIESVTTRLGERRTLLLCWGALLGSVVLALIANVVADDFGWPLIAASLAAAGLIAFNALLYRRNSRRGVLATFPCVAAAAGLVAIAWVAAIT